MKHCHHCDEPILSDYVSIRDACPHCGTDLHVCFNCVFYDPMSHHECREPQSELVRDKDKNNFCDYYRFKVEKRREKTRGETEEAKARLEALFKKEG
jgi:hypothetical protein